MKKFFLLGTFLSLFVLGGCSSSQQIAATIDGKSITIEEVDQAFGGKAAQQVYNTRRNILENLIDQKLLEQEAAAKKTTVEELLKQELDTKIGDPSEEEIKAIYDANKDQFEGTYEAAKDQIANILKRNRRNTQENSFLAGLREKAKVEVKLSAPPAQRVEVSVDDDPSLGSDVSAKITLIEFSDYQCPFCGRARGTVNQILETYKEDVHYVFRDFPLGFHKEAFAAHVAAQCANDQGKYWEYNKLLFANQRGLQVEKLKGYAKDLNLKTDEFNQCLDTNKYESEVQKDMQAGIQAGVSGTPAFFINGIPISGAQPFENFKTIIDDELKKKK